MWHSEEEDAQLDHLRKKAVKVKHVKRREKKLEKKVGAGLTSLLMMSLKMSLTQLRSFVEVCFRPQRGGEAPSSQGQAATQGARAP